MKRDLMEILACPVCKGELLLNVVTEDSGEITEGSLHCNTCDDDYPIKDSIPILLPPALRG